MRPPLSPAQRQARQTHTQRLQEWRDSLARRKQTWPLEPRGTCSRCGTALTNATIKHLGIHEPYLGERGAVFMRGGPTLARLCPACVDEVIAFANEAES